MKYRPFKKQALSKSIRPSHVSVIIRGTEKDFERAKSVIREAVYKYNRFSNNKMSYEVRMVNDLNNHGEKN